LISVLSRKLVDQALTNAPEKIARATATTVDPSFLRLVSHDETTAQVHPIEHEKTRLVSTFMGTEAESKASIPSSMLPLPEDLESESLFNISMMDVILAKNATKPTIAWIGVSTR